MGDRCTTNTDLRCWQGGRTFSAAQLALALFLSYRDHLRTGDPPSITPPVLTHQRPRPSWDVFVI